MNNNDCKYCVYTGSNDAWKSHIALDTNMVSTNVEAVISDISVMVKDYGNTVSSKDTQGYKDYVKEHPGVLEIRSSGLGKMVYPDNRSVPLIIDIGINYCPMCGKKLGE